MTGGGWAGTWHSIDPMSGIGVVFGVQIVPPFDMPSLQLYTQIEGLIYANLLPKEVT